MAKTPLLDNGAIRVHYGEGRVLDYELASIHYRLHDSGVGVCTLNEPQRLNALTRNQIWEYMLILQHAERDDRVKVLLWTGHGRAFSSGADLRGEAPKPALKKEAMDWFIEQGFTPGVTVPARPDIALKCLTLRFWDFPKPMVVAVNGLAVGGAANIALANYQDIVLASTEARFMFPFANIGLTPELGSSYMMPMLVGMTRAKKMMMTGEWLSAEEAKSMGLVLEVLPPERLMARAMEVAEGLAAKKPSTLRLIKRVLNRHARRQLEEVLDEENRTINEAIAAAGSNPVNPKPRPPASKL